MTLVMNSSFPIKLESARNYAAWKTQFEPLLNMHNLTGHISGADPEPPAEITFSTNPHATFPNPAYESWFHRDQMLLSSIHSLISESAFFHIIGITSAYKAWQALEHAYGSASKYRQLQLYLELQSLKQNDDSVSDYLRQAKELAEELGVAGRVISDTELNAIIYRNIGADYQGTVFSAVNRKPDPLTFQELHGELIARENLLKLLKPPSADANAFRIQPFQTFGRTTGIMVFVCFSILSVLSR